MGSFRFKPLALALAPLLLVGCGGDSATSTEVQTISGKVLGSLISGAKVCVDENLNGRCDSTDGFTVFSDSNGSYTIGELTPDLYKLPIVVEVPENAQIVDPITGSTTEVGTKYRLSYPPSEIDNRFVSALSTLVSSEFSKLGNLSEAKSAVASKLESAGLKVTGDELLSDYVETATNTEATADQKKVYNTAKLAGQVLRATQESTATNEEVAATALLALATEKVFASIDYIEQQAALNTTLINQESADVIVKDLATSVDLTISSDQVDQAAKLEWVDFDLGPVLEASVLNRMDSSDPSDWDPVTWVKFDTPGGVSASTLDDYRKNIPSTYEIGVLNDSGELLQVGRFDKELWSDNDTIKHWYGVWDGDFEIYFRDFERVQWDVGTYSIVLCPEGCDQSNQIKIGTAALEPYDQDLDIGGTANIDRINKIASEEIQFITSDREAFREGDEQIVWVSQPPPPHNTSYRITLGIGAQLGALDETRANGTVEAFNRLYIPNSWIDEEKLYATELLHRDGVGIENTSWEVKTSTHPTELTKTSSFAVDNIFDVYRGEYYTDRPFQEGFDTEIRVYVDENNPLSGLAYLDAEGNPLASICLPSDLPSSQDKIAVYQARHQRDGEDTHFTGCYQFNIGDEFGLSGENLSASSEIAGRTSRSANVEILRINFYMLTDDTDSKWGEPGVIFQDMDALEFTFSDGTVLTYPVDLPLPPAQDFSISGAPSFEVCKASNTLTRVTWAPPGWMLEEFNKGELSTSFRIRALDENGNSNPDWERDTYEYSTRKGANSTTVPTDYIRVLAGEDVEIPDYRVEAYVGDMDYYDWAHRTYWTKSRQLYTAEDLLDAPACE